MYTRKKTPSDGTSAENQKEVKDLYNAGLYSYQRGEYQYALRSFDNALALDFEPAIIHFYFAKSYDALGDFGLAKYHYTVARDHDKFPHRATSQINTIIRNTASTFNIQLADLDDLFQKQSPNHLPGSNIFVDQCHPNSDGHKLIAEELSKYILAK